MKVRAVIFDLGGTLVDPYSMSPLRALQHAFKKHGYYLTANQINMYMGLAKPKHIAMVVSDYYREAHRSHTDIDLPVKIKPLYASFKEKQMELLSQEIEILPGVQEAYHYLKYNNIKVGVTTGYSRDETQMITDHLEKEGLVFDSVVSSDEVEKSRPHPDLVIKNLEIMNIDQMLTASVLKIDDSLYGLREGLRAGCTTVGVARYSCMMTSLILGDDDISEYMKDIKIDQVREGMLDLGADHTIDDMKSLPVLIERM